jgi:type IV secretion system protein VirB8
MSARPLVPGHSLLLNFVNQPEKSAMKSKVEKEDFQKYLAEARSWETDKVAEANKSKRRAYVVAAIGSLAAIVSIAAVASLAPLKTVEPFVVRVDSATGVVDVVNALKDGKTNYDEAVNKFFTQWYVRYREGYSKELAPDYYQNVGVMSVGVEQQKYYEWFTPKNPNSPLNIYGANAKVKIDIKGTSFISPNVALVRYTRKIERAAEQPQLSHWTATITFKYSGAPMKEKDREVNPLGFQVTEFRNDPDADPTGNMSKIAKELPPQPTQTQAQTNVQLYPGQRVAVTAPAQLPTAPATQIVPAPVTSQQGAQQ